MKVVEHGYMLPRKAVKSSSLKKFKTQIDKAMDIPL